MKKYLIALIVIIAAAAIWLLFFKKTASAEQKFTFSNITRGNLDVKITSTGTLEALSTVEVGTQVSGTISKIYADYNYNVKKGQLLAMIDTVTLAANVRDQMASVAKAKAAYNNALRVNKINTELHTKGFLSDLDYSASQTALETAHADLQSAESALERAKINLGYALIRSPINGKVINRSVEMGQTVAASFATPTLFTIAENLGKMRILANVDESDIGQIKMNQDVDFSVQSYPNKVFHGNVDQIRLSPQTVQNVVNYIVVVNADNSEGLLLPGMTATVDFYTAKKENILLVPNAALRFQPSAQLLSDLGEKSDTARIQAAPRPRPTGSGGFNERPANAGGINNTKLNFTRIWYLDNNKKLKSLPIVIGQSDGRVTEIIQGKDVNEGMKVITGLLTADQNPAAGGPPRGGFGRRPF